jgi:hypothetical protein
MREPQPWFVFFFFRLNLIMEKCYVSQNYSELAMGETQPGFFFFFFSPEFNYGKMLRITKSQISRVTQQASKDLT